MKLLRNLLVGVSLCSFHLQAEAQHGIAMHGDMKYGKEFKHFDVVNPTAPQGGEYRMGLVGTFDSVNPFITKGKAAAGVRELTIDGLLKRSPDEPFSLYGLIAESVDVALDRSWVIYTLNPKAKWHDGKPITVNDVKFSLEIQRDRGNPSRKLFFVKVDTVEILNDKQIKFTFKKIDGQYDAEMPLIIGLMAILPEHYFKTVDFEKTGLTPILGSGPYKISEIDPGRKIVYQKVDNYWAKDLPVNKGIYNFDQVRFEYFGNTTVAFEAFKSGEIDLWEETDPSAWIKEYDFHAIQDGRVSKVEIPHRHQVGMNAFAFNIRNPLFVDEKVRRALAYVFDFEWLNKNIYYGTLTRTLSFFDNTELASKGLPQGEELALLEKYKEKLPNAVFTEEYKLPTTDGSGNIREHLRQAKRLLAEAGWVTKDGKLLNEKTGKPFEFEILLNSPANEKVALAFSRNLGLLGVKANVRTVDSAQYENRRVNKDYDMIISFWGHTLSPGSEQKYYWSSLAADAPGTRNYPGIKSPAIDALCDDVTAARSRKDLITAIRALDRSLLAHHLIIPIGHRSKDYIAYWNKLEHPTFGPDGIPNFTMWWMKTKENEGSQTK
ncbi:ABC transporter substrate-binding protein [Candidatus Bealeia paramacronuclearis]|uniref:ABC transporter substrate-binding protein n=1 Tax=Candidatus Bealeia paramacronuclearis TaxID=1921001 RepID=A0ABZ2C0Q6_9PROT|nr:ABC transporter substrate-binding protein [Candidatus Bealeia paramacronuclearis]